MHLETAAAFTTSFNIQRRRPPLPITPINVHGVSTPLSVSNCIRPTSSSRSCLANTINNQTHLSNLNRILGVDGQQRSFNSSSHLLATYSLDHLLSDVLPAARKVSEMSPVSLRHLRHVLSDDPKPSPRGDISHRWRLLHGSDDWSGLLDPLDEDLRRELLRYGEHVHVAYRTFHQSDGTRGQADLLPDKFYRVTADLYATSSINLPALKQQRSSWIGYVAVCDSQKEIERLGRRDVVIALRGTSTFLEWVENFRNVLVPVPVGSDNEDAKCHVAAKAECGFLSLLKTKSTGNQNHKSLSETISDEVNRLIKSYPNEQLSITITGHSLGAALAILVADEVSRSTTLSKHTTPVPVTVFSFGGPRVGNIGFAERIRQRGVKVLRVVNEQDVITRVPGIFVNDSFGRRLRQEDHGGGDFCGDLRRRILQVLDGNMYADVGTELRVNSRQSPYLREDAGLDCCHDLEAYLHLVDGYHGSGCPFRWNAKRSILRLLTHQSSDVKKIVYKNNKKKKNINNNNNNNSKEGAAAAVLGFDATRTTMAVATGEGED